MQKCMYKNYSYFSMTEKHKNPTNVPILKKFHRVVNAQLAFENASKPTFFSSRYQNKNPSSYGVAHAHDFFCVDERGQHAGKR